jgi:hypothetical protein
MQSDSIHASHKMQLYKNKKTGNFFVTFKPRTTTTIVPSLRECILKSAKETSVTRCIIFLNINAIKRVQRSSRDSNVLSFRSHLFNHKISNFADERQTASEFQVYSPSLLLTL